MRPFRRPTAPAATDPVRPDDFSQRRERATTLRVQTTPPVCPFRMSAHASRLLVQRLAWSSFLRLRGVSRQRKHAIEGARLPSKGYTLCLDLGRRCRNRRSHRPALSISDLAAVSPLQRRDVHTTILARPAPSCTNTRTGAPLPRRAVGRRRVRCPACCRPYPESAHPKPASAGRGMATLCVCVCVSVWTRRQSTWMSQAPRSPLCRVSPR
jgi:hypothetical protein